MNKLRQKQIDNMSYEHMLSHIRFDSIGDEAFLGEEGDYFLQIFYEKKAALPPGEHTAASKRIGWRKNG